MSRTTRGLPIKCIALAVLLVVAGALVAGAAVARHHHAGAGLYDERCPLQALATVERPGSVIAAVTATPVEVVAVLAAVFVVVCGPLPPAADARLRAPPAR
jgi:hypothetical protein